MTLVARPVPPVVGAPDLSVPAMAGVSCTCDDPGVARLLELMACGMSQREASRLLWSPTVAEMVREALLARIPWLRLEGAW